MLTGARQHPQTRVELLLPSLRMAAAGRASMTSRWPPEGGSAGPNEERIHVKLDDAAPAEFENRPLPSDRSGQRGLGSQPNGHPSNPVRSIWAWRSNCAFVEVGTFAVRSEDG